MKDWKFSIALDYIELHSFRGIDKIKLDFDKKLTVLIGENGSGKTTILDALASLLQVFVDKITNKETGRIEANYISTNDIKNGTIEAINTLSTLFTFDGGVVKKNENGKEPEEDEELEFEDTTYHGLLEWYLTLNQDGYIGDDKTNSVDFIKISEIIRSISLNYKSNLKEKEKTKHVPLSVPLVVYYPTLSISTKITDLSGRMRTDLMSGFDDALTYSSFDFTKFFRWYRWQENIKIQLGKNTLLDAVADAIYQMLNDEKEEAVFYNLRTDWLNNEDGELFINKGSDKNTLKMSQFSSGEKSILALTADLARRLAITNPYAENPLHGNGIVLIDEIDLHLHPRWQRAILPKLMSIFPNIQWVVTTHSPLVLQNIEQDKATVFFVENGELVDKEINHFGRDIDDMLIDIYQLGEKRPMVQKDLNKLFELIDNEEYEKAKEKIKELAKKGLTYNDSELVQATTLIDFMEDEELLIEN
jgi:predicted ATP-binding protein involved in virulence